MFKPRVLKPYQLVAVPTNQSRERAAMTQLPLLAELTGTSFTGVLLGVHSVGQTPLLAGRAKVSGQTYLFELPDLPPSSMVLLTKWKVMPGTHTPQLQRMVDSDWAPHQPELQWPYTFVELCAGSAFMGQGFEAAGFLPGPCVEWSSAVCNVLRLDKVHVLCCDVATPHLGCALLRHLRGIRPVVIAGSACQPWSQLGDGHQHADPRAGSLHAILRLTVQLQAPCAVLENVTQCWDDPHTRQLLDFNVRAPNAPSEQCTCLAPWRRRRASPALTKDCDMALMGL